MGMMIRHNRLRKAQGAVQPAPTPVAEVTKPVEAVAEPKQEAEAVTKTEKRGRRKQQ